MSIVSSYIPFAPIAWWAQLAHDPNVIFDKAEHYEKMSYRNKYNISGANNPIQLSIPLVSGRNQRTVMADVLICNDTDWQTQHWRTLTSVYRQTPFWEFYAHTLEHLYTKTFERLTDFNSASFSWVAQQLKLISDASETDIYLPHYPEGIADMRKIKPSTDKTLHATFPRYYQIFEERIGFQPNLSILDLLFSEGPQTKNWLLANAGLLCK